MYVEDYHYKAGADTRYWCARAAVVGRRLVVLTRLKVSGFKNLVEVDVSFGPFTCITGVNGTGKSNLLDAILFLSALSDLPLADAARRVRGAQNGPAPLFHRTAVGQSGEMTFEAEMIIPESGFDDFGEAAHAAITFLRYSLTLAGRPDCPAQPLAVKAESLAHITLGDAHAHLPFQHTLAWRRTVVRGRRAVPLISTRVEDGESVIHLHQDGDPPRALTRSAALLRRTVLSGCTTAENPTALLARREMQSWRMLNLDPSAMRRTVPLHAAHENGAAQLVLLHHLAEREHLGESSFADAQDSRESHVESGTYARLLD